MGLAVPILVVASMFGSTALRKKPWFRTRLIPLYALVVVILALAFVNSAANHFGYALPWQLPSHVHYRAATTTRTSCSGVNLGTSKGLPGRTVGSGVTSRPQRRSTFPPVRGSPPPPHCL